MMTWLLKHNLRSVGKSASLDPQFRRALRESLADRGYVSTSLIRRVPVWKTGFALSGMVLSMGTGTGVYAYTSDNVLPDQPLYSVRQQIESVETRLARTPDSLEAVRLKHLGRRVHEAQILHTQNKPLSASHVAALTVGVQSVTKDAPIPPASESEVEISDMMGIESKEIAELASQRRDADTDEDRKRIDDLVGERVKTVEKSVKKLQEKHAIRQIKKAEKSEDPGDEPVDEVEE